MRIVRPYVRAFLLKERECALLFWKNGKHIAYEQERSPSDAGKEERT